MRKIILALILMEQFAMMTDTCAARKTCIGCPYYRGRVCDMISTRRAIRIIGNVSREYLYEEGYYPLNKKQFEEELKKLLPVFSGSSSSLSEDIQKLTDTYQQSPSES